MQECAPVLEPCSQGEKSRNAVGPGKSARHTNAINQEAMGSWGWFSFSSSKVNQGKEAVGVGFHLVARRSTRGKRYLYGIV